MADKYEIVKDIGAFKTALKSRKNCAHATGKATELHTRGAPCVCRFAGVHGLPFRPFPLYICRFWEFR